MTTRHDQDQLSDREAKMAELLERIVQADKLADDTYNAYKKRFETDALRMQQCDPAFDPIKAMYGGSTVAQALWKDHPQALQELGIAFDAYKLRLTQLERDLNGQAKEQAASRRAEERALREADAAEGGVFGRVKGLLWRS